MITDLKEINKRPWYKTYPEEIRNQLESFSLPKIPVYRFLESSGEILPGIGGGRL